MLSIDSSSGPVDLPLHASTGPSWRWGLAVGALALAVPVARLVHPVAWWGWLSALVLATAGMVIARRPAPRRRVERLVADGDVLRLVLDGAEREVPASRIVRVAGHGEGFVPVLVLDDGSEVAVPVRLYWQDSAVPTARVLARWVTDHGGGTQPWDGRLRTRADTGARRPLWQDLALYGLVWLVLSLWFSALAGHPRPRLGNLGPLLGALFGGRVVQQRTGGRVKDWMAPPPVGIG